MSLQRIAVIQAVSSHNGLLRNRTFYYERRQNDTNFDPGLNFQQHFNILIGGASLSFVIMLMCVMCYCFNKSINKNSMALYRRRLMEARNQNVDIYTVEQFYEAEAYAPLCESQSTLPTATMLPPSYEAVMASEKALLSKYAEMCKSKTCCEHAHLSYLNRPLNANQQGDDECTQDNNSNGDIDSKTDAALVAENKMLDGNGNEITTGLVPSSPCCCQADELNGNIQCDCRTFSSQCCCLDNCANKCSSNIIIDVASTSTERNNNGSVADTMAGEPMEIDDNSKCICDHHHHHHHRHTHRKQSAVEIDILSDNGIVRMDMSKIIDRTGLPTYDAAIKLESYGYV